MNQTRVFATLLVGFISMAVPAFSQREMETSGHEVSAQAFGSFVTSTTQNGIENKATHSGGVLGSYRYWFSRNSGIEANYGYAFNTQSYGLTPGAIGVKTYSHEVSGSYVYRYPLRKFTPFALAGAGALIFDPKDFTGAKTQSRAAFIYGAGVDYNLLRNVFLRAEYRGLVYKSPTYDLPALSGVDRVTHRAVPSIGIGYRF